MFFVFNFCFGYDFVIVMENVDRVFFTYPIE